MPNRIPKRIIQMWIGGGNYLTLGRRAVVANIRLLNPDFEYLFLDDAKVEEFIEHEFPQYREIVNSFRFRIQRCDFLRYLAVYRYGGFYFDLDVLLATSLSPLLKYGCVFSFERLGLSLYLRDNLGMDWQVMNGAFGAEPGHPFLKAIIENCIRGQNEPKWIKPMMRGTPPFSHERFFVINSTGPGMVSRTLAENPGLAQRVRVLFPDDVCDPTNWERFGDYGIILSESNWVPHKNFVFSKIGDYWWRWIEHRRIKQSRRLGKTRDQPGSISARLGLDVTRGQVAPLA